jgi:hypothetical protein
MNSSLAYLQSQFAVSKALGDRSLQSDALMVIDGFEFLTMLLKDFVWPVVSTAGEVEIWLPNGQRALQQQQIETAFTGNVVIMETSSGIAEEALAQLAGQNFDATVYEGNALSYTRGAFIRQCFFKVEPAERSFEGRSQVTQYNCEMSYHYFGERLPGNLVPSPI